MSYHTPGQHGQAKPQNGTANQATSHHGIAHHTKTSHRMAWPSHRTVQHATSIYSIPPIETSVAKRKEGYDAFFAVTSGASGCGRYYHHQIKTRYPHPTSPWLQQNAMAPSSVSDHGSLHHLIVTVAPPSILHQHGFNEISRLHH